MRLGSATWQIIPTTVLQDGAHMGFKRHVRLGMGSILLKGPKGQGLAFDDPLTLASGGEGVAVPP